jgi:hypothetical protein
LHGLRHSPGTILLLRPGSPEIAMHVVRMQNGTLLRAHGKGNLMENRYMLCFLSGTL